MHERKLLNFLLEMPMLTTGVPCGEVEVLGIPMELSSCPFGIGSILFAQMPLLLFTALVHNDIYGPV